MRADVLSDRRCRSGRTAGRHPTPEKLDLLIWPGAVAGHRATLESVEDLVRIGPHVVVGRQIEKPPHRANIPWAKQRTNIPLVADCGLSHPNLRLCPLL